jgi:hypothetical protein
MSSHIRDLSSIRRALIESVKKAFRQTSLESMEKRKLEFPELGVTVTVTIEDMFNLLRFKSVQQSQVCNPLTEFVDILQGVTWGGRGSEKIFWLSEDEVKELRLESELLFKGIGGEDVKKWRVKWKGYYILFPYKARESSWIRAFKIDDKVRSLVDDALDFTKCIDDFECTIMQESIPENEKVKYVLDHRIALGLIGYPNVATYLAQYYQQLRSRSFEEKPIEQYNKMWYEYHRPRTPELVSKPKIVSPRLTREARFALDTHGYLPRDSVVALIPKQGSFGKLRDELSKVLDREVTEEEVLMYLLAFLNSKSVNQLLSEKISKKRGGYVPIDEKLLQSICIPIPAEKHRESVEKLLDLVRNAVTAEEGSDDVEKEINSLVQMLQSTGKQ